MWLIFYYFLFSIWKKREKYYNLDQSLLEVDDRMLKSLSWRWMNNVAITSPKIKKTSLLFWWFFSVFCVWDCRVCQESCFFVSLSLWGRLSVFLFGSTAHCGAAWSQIPTSCMKARVLPVIPAGRNTALQSVQRVKEAILEEIKENKNIGGRKKVQML